MIKALPTVSVGSAFYFCFAGLLFFPLPYEEESKRTDNRR